MYSISLKTFCGRVFMAIFMLLASFAGLQAQSWTSLGGPNKPRDVKDIAISADGATIYVADATSLFKSTNTGSAWAKTTSAISSPLLVTTKQDDPSNIVVAISGTLKQSSDGGTNWPNSQSINGSMYRLSTSSVNTAMMYMGKQYVSTTNSVYRSTNGGGSWSGASNFTWSTNVADIAPYPNANQRAKIWVVGGDNTTDGTDSSTTASTRGVWVSADSGVHWTQNKLGSYSLSAIAIRDRGAANNEYLFAGTATGKLFYSTDAGGTWSQRTAYGTATSATTIRSIRVRTDSTIMYVVSDKGIHKSTDDGANWTSISGSLLYQNVLALAIKPNDQRTMFATTDRALYKTTDAGVTWSEIDDGAGATMAAQSATGTGPYAWAVSKDYSVVAKYDSAGNSWSSVNLGSAASPFIGENVTRHSNGDLFVAGSENNQAKLYRSTDAGASFSAVTVSGADGSASGNTFKAIYVDPVNSSAVYVVGKGTSGGSTYNFFKSGSSGTGSYSSTQIGTGGHIVNALAFDTAGAGGLGSKIIYAGLENYGVWKSTDWGGTWSPEDTNGHPTVLSLASNWGVAGELYAATTSGIKHKTQYTSWAYTLAAAPKVICMMPGITGNSAYLDMISATDSLRYSYNSGANWVYGGDNSWGTVYSMTPRQTSGTAGLYVAGSKGVYSVLAPSDAVSISSPGSNPALNFTASWSSVSRAITYRMIEHCTTEDHEYDVIANGTAATSYVNNNLYPTYSYTMHVYAQNPAGESPSQSATSFTATNSSSITLDATGKSCSGGICHPIISWTGGTSPFTIYRYSCAYGVSCPEVYPLPIIATNASSGYIDNDVTVAGKFDTPATTYYYRVGGSALSNQSSVNSTDGGGEEKAATETLLPKETKLNPSYPNPFNPVTTISYDLSKDGFVSLKVYNILGQEVATLVNGEEKAGFKSVQFDGTRLGSGVYFCTMQAPGYTKMTKLMLVK